MRAPTTTPARDPGSSFILGEILRGGVGGQRPPTGTASDAETARQFPANPTAPLWYNAPNPITAETERTR